MDSAPPQTAKSRTPLRSTPTGEHVASLGVTSNISTGAAGTAEFLNRDTESLRDAVGLTKEASATSELARRVAKRHQTRSRIALSYILFD